MRPLLRYCLLLLTAGCSAVATAAAPTPQQIAEIQRLWGLDLAYEHLISTKFDSMVELRSLPAGEQQCLKGTLRAQVLDSANRDLGAMFVDEETIAAWISFAATPGGTKVMQGLRDTLTAHVTGLPAPDMSAVEASMDPGEQVDLFRFQNSPAGEVVKKGFPAAKAIDPAELRAAVERCGIAQGSS